MRELIRRALCGLAVGSTLPWAGGCLYLPATSAERATDADQVGGAGSDRPFRVGVAKRSQIVEAFGTPSYTTADGAALGYVFSAVEGRRGYVALGGPCLLHGEYPITLRGQETLLLAFDASGTLCRYSTSRDDSRASWERFLQTPGAAAGGK